MINQSLAPLALTDPILRSRRFHERPFIQEVSEELAPRTALVPWQADIARAGANSCARTRVPRIRRRQWVKETTMKTIQVLGIGCAKCTTLAANAERAVRESGIEGQVVKVREIAEMLAFEAVCALPALAIDGRVALLRSRAERPSDQGDPSVVACLRADNRL